MSLFFSGLFWVLGLMMVTAVLAVILRKARQRFGREANNEVAGQVFTIVGGVNVVIAAFVLISLFDATDKADENTYQEANALVAVRWASESLAEPARSRVEELTQSYANEVVQVEWPALRAGGPVGGQGWELLSELQGEVERVPTRTDREENSRIEASTQLWNVYQARQDRLNASGNGVSAIVWFAILVGSAMSVGLMFMFGGPGVYSYAVIVSMLSGAIALMLFAIYQLQDPFSGGASVGPDAYVAALTRLARSG
ncbi:hypothetical protein Kfla_4243 [Kribbella flavida DSM 17836]|uniref:Integral membrane protein n=1 Tax=Kribbella flavida (strain DSM 17836 / JCM 10339 / NBRC 14399) TaxID=479435 RepID=D2PTZ6_KRIFD|nr:DUF4239 domain-containing protein [Kribbella flavida]ADB33279.1 hypothetical protein Kfla_4243 [Kribbella flavida DSM 17836]